MARTWRRPNGTCVRGYRFMCATCNEHEWIISDDVEAANTLIRKLGWMHSYKEGWFCPEHVEAYTASHPKARISSRQNTKAMALTSQQVKAERALTGPNPHKGRGSWQTHHTQHATPNDMFTYLTQENTRLNTPSIPSETAQDHASS